jgi:hypothetical protein
MIYLISCCSPVHRSSQIGHCTHIVLLVFDKAAFTFIWLDQMQIFSRKHTFGPKFLNLADPVFESSGFYGTWQFLPITVWIPPRSPKLTCPLLSSTQLEQNTTSEVSNFNPSCYDQANHGNFITTRIKIGVDYIQTVNILYIQRSPTRLYWPCRPIRSHDQERNLQYDSNRPVRHLSLAPN